MNVRLMTLQESKEADTMELLNSAMIILDEPKCNIRDEIRELLRMGNPVFIKFVKNECQRRQSCADTKRRRKHG